MLLLALCLALPVQAIGTYEGMSLAELRLEIETIVAAAWKTEEWQVVEVPSGVYQVGVHIPAGEWTIGGDDEPLVTIASKLNETKTDYASGSIIDHEYIKKEYFPNGWTVFLTEGQYVIIDGIAVFTPPVSVHKFTFK